MIGRYKHLFGKYSCHLRADDERLHWQFDFDSKLTIVSLFRWLCVPSHIYMMLKASGPILYRTNMLHITTSVSRLMNILCKKFKI